MTTRSLMKSPLLGFLLCLSSEIACLGGSYLSVSYSGDCNSYNYDIWSLCAIPPPHIICGQFGPGVSEHTWTVSNGCAPVGVHVQVFAHTCGLPGEEFLVYDGFIAEGATDYITMSGPCPLLDEPSDGDDCDKQ